jgi:hypothetical protein
MALVHAPFNDGFLIAMRSSRSAASRDPFQFHSR